MNPDDVDDTQDEDQDEPEDDSNEESNSSSKKRIIGSRPAGDKTTQTNR